MKTRVTQLFNIDFPIIQGGMIWNSSWRLAAAVSNAGGLGLIGAASMYPDVLKMHIHKCKEATSLPFGVNVPLLYPDIDKIMKIIIENEVKIVFTSAGNPSIWTKTLKQHGIKVVHVVSSAKFARKAEVAGVDAVVAEGFEAGGHNGREETTTLCLIPEVVDSIEIPVIAAGGISSGKSMLATLALGAEGVQLGSRFAASEEASGHENFKNEIISLKEGGTKLSMKKHVPVRMMKNSFYKKIQIAEDNGASIEELKSILGRARAKKGMFEGDIDEGELEIGQVASQIKEIKPAGDIVLDIVRQFNVALLNVEKFKNQ